MMARRLTEARPLQGTLPLRGVPIVVSRDRVVGCQWLIDHFKVEVILLDDGYQHLRLHRDLNILLIDTTQTNTALLPKGPMREPLVAARRADVVLLTRQEAASPPSQAAGAIKMLDTAGFTGPILQTAFYPVALIGLTSGISRPVSTLLSEPIVAVCGLGNPNAFIKMLEQLGAKICDTVLFPDHFDYTVADMQKIEIKRKALGAKTMIVTTEKDAVKIALLPIESIDIWALRICITFLDPPEKWERLLATKTRLR